MNPQLGVEDNEYVVTFYEGSVAMTYTLENLVKHSKKWADIYEELIKQNIIVRENFNHEKKEAIKKS